TVDQQLHAGVLVLADQIDPLGHDADKAPQGPAASQPLTLRRHRGLVAGEQQAVVVRLFNGILIALRCIALTAKHRELVPHLSSYFYGFYGNFAVHSPLPPACHAPDHITHIVRDQHGAVGTDRHADRSAIRHPLLRCEEARENIAWWPGWASACERHQNNLVAAQLAPVPGTVLPDGHALGKAGKRAGRQPADTQRRGVSAQRVVRCYNLYD